jgi:anti-sigma factor RsiW
MNQSSPFSISDELLSAYIDGDVSEAEKQQIEIAIAADPEIAWQVETLRQTVALLRQMPSISLPRSFVLQEDQVADILQARRSSASRSAAGADHPSIWQRLRKFFNTGNLALRNASALATTLFIIITVSRTFLAGGPMMPMVAQSDQAAMFEAAPAPAAESAEEAAPSIMMATSEGEEPALMESQAADMAADSSMADSGMPAAAARSMPAAEEQSAAEEQPAAEEQSAAEEQPPPPLSGTDQTTAYQTDPAPTTPVEDSADVTTLRALPMPEPTPEPQAVPVAEAFALEAPAGAAASEPAAPETESARVMTSEDAIRAESVPAEEPIAEQPFALEESTETESAAVESIDDEAGTDEAIAEDSSIMTMTKSTSDEPLEIERDQVEAAEEDAAIATPDEPYSDTVSMAGGVAADAVEQPVQLVEPASASADPAQGVAAGWDVWQIMQIGVLVLAFILLLLWLGSRQRSLR